MTGKYQDNIIYSEKVLEFLRSEFPDVTLTEAAYLMAAIYKHYHESNKRQGAIEKLIEAGYFIAKGRQLIPSTVEERFDILVNEIDVELQYEVIKLMSYQEFLASGYWKIIRDYILHTRGRKCQLCNTSDSILDVHHSTYEHHGYEHLYLNDLIILCRECHSKFHDKIA